MLDLNLTAVSCHSSTTQEKKKTLEPSGYSMESSGTFNSSSTVNAGGCADGLDSCSNGGSKPVDDDDDRTIQLFPLKYEVNNERGRSSWVSTVQMQLSLDLGGRRDYDGPVEQRSIAQEEEEQQQQQKPLQQVKKSRRGPPSKSSQYRGVTFYRRTGRWESHIWDCGKQVYLGGFDTAHAAARAYDRAAIKFRGVDADINFTVSNYDEDIKQMSNFTKEEFVHIVCRHSTGFSRGTSKCRGVTLHKCGRWEARMGQFLGKKAYDKAAIKSNGREAIANFEPSTYEGEMLTEAKTRDGNQTLDLTLGITPPDTSDGVKVNSHTAGFHFQSGLEGMSIDRGPKTLNSASETMKNQLPNGLAMASKHPYMWDGINSSFFPMYEERAIEKRMGVDPLPVWTRQIQGSYGGTNPLTLSSTAAASSGFASSTIMAPSAGAESSRTAMIQNLFFI